MPEYTLR